MFEKLLVTEPRVVKDAQTLTVDTKYVVADLPRHGQSIAYIDLYIEGVENHSVTPSAAGLFYNLIKSLSVKMDSKLLLDEISGKDLFNLNTMLAGARIEHAAPAADDEACFARLRIWLIDPRAPIAQQKRAARDLGKLTNFTLNFETQALSDVWASGTLAMTSMNYTIIFGDIPGAIIDGDIVNVFRVNSYTMNGTEEKEEWKEDRMELKRMMVLGYDGSTLSDSVITTLGLKIGGKVEIIPKLPWGLHRSRTIDHTGLDADLLATGVAFLNLSEKGQPRIFLSQRTAVTPLFKGTSDKIIRFVNQLHIGRRAFFGF